MQPLRASSPVRINIESIFQQFDSQLSAALAKAALETIPGMTTKSALRLYSTFRRNAITALSTWEPVPADMLSETGRSEDGPAEAGSNQTEPKP